ncbi:MAG: pyridoxamine 5'-phosphate oxidase family protein [Pseudomonadota bacterium]
MIDDHTLAFPDYDGNGIYRSRGNVLIDPAVGLLFLDFESPKRLRVNGTGTVSADDPLCTDFPGAVFIVRVVADKIFPNCPRYMHKMQLIEYSVYAPRADYTPPVPAWKTFDASETRCRRGTGTTLTTDARPSQGISLNARLPPRAGGAW